MVYFVTGDTGNPADSDLFLPEMVPETKLGKPVVAFFFLWILVGAAITHFAGKEGIMHIREGETVDYMFVGERMERQTVPFRVTLTDFRLKRYPGSHSPSSYESDLVVFHQGREEKVGVKMNKVVNVEGYRLFQSSYDPDERGTVLTVSYDCPGMQITYIGYVLWCWDSWGSVLDGIPVLAG